ncbi:MAG: zinc ribbon domain-containing protein [Bacteroides sp.]|nr:zinc ribbon domain-containing protein [Bacteroides sp.]
MEDKFCQSCGMPMKEDAQHGKNADGTLNEDYCCYCYTDGRFAQECTMEEMIQHCAAFVDEFNKDSEVKFTKGQAIAGMREFFPSLKRWNKQA